MYNGYPMNYYVSYFHFLAAIVYAILGIIIINKDPRSRLNQTGTAVFFCFFCWSFSFVFVHHPDVSQKTAELAEKFGSIGWVGFAFFHLWFTWLYARRRPFRHFIVVAFFLGIVPAALVYQQMAHSAIYTASVHCDFGWLTLLTKSPWAYAYIVFFPAEALTSLYILYDCYRKTDNTIVRHQALVLLISGFLTLLAGTMTNVVLPKILPRPPVPIADIAALFWALGLAYVAVRFKRLDINPFIAAQRIIIAMNDLLFLLDTHGRIISVNPAALASLLCSENDLIGRSFAEIIAKTDNGHAALAREIVASPVSAMETVLAVGPGPSVPVSLSTSLIEGTGIVCVAHDVSLLKQRTELLSEAKKRLENEVSLAVETLKKTNEQLTLEIAERKQAALSLMETEERFRIIYEFAPDGIFLIDTQGRFIDGNKEACRILGYRPDELKRLNAFTLGILRADGDDRTPNSSETTLLKKDETPVPVEINSHPIKIGDRNLHLGVVRDLTHKKKAEQEAEELKLQLEQVQKMEAIGRLAGGIAHDFNNLLGGIIGYAGLLTKKLERHRPAEAGIVSKIIDVARQASQRTAQLMAFARKGKYQVVAVNIHGLIDDVVGLLENTIDRKIALKKKFDAPSATVMGDRSQLHSALLNLGVNARDALPGGGEIAFSTAIVPIGEEAARAYPFSVAPGIFLKVSVADNGVGMDEKTRARVFEPFFSTKEPGKGTGLGLASVYGTVKNHGGFIEFRSEPGQGTVFDISLPLSDVPEIKSEKEPSATAQPAPEKRPGRILLVDDMPVLREIAGDMLRDLGHTVQVCQDGSEALEWFRANHERCDLVILDLSMPKLGGRDCLRAMNDVKPGIKAIITSGHALDDEITDLLKEGASAFLQKPFENQKLSETVQRALSTEGKTWPAHSN